MGFVTKRIRQAADGSEQVRWRARWTDLEGREREKIFTSRSEARRYLLARESEARLSGLVEPGADRRTFAQWWDEWTATKLWAPETALAAAGSRAAVPFADVELRQLTRRQLQQWVKAMTDPTDDLPDGLAPRTIRLRFGYVHRCLSAAVREGVLRIDPSAAITLPRRPRGEAEMHLPTIAEVDRLVHAAPPDFAAFVYVCAHAGLRRGEAAGLVAGDLDRERSAIHVRRQAQTVDGNPVFRHPKWGSARIVTVPAAVLDHLDQHLARHGGFVTGQGLALFGNARGSLLSTSAINERWYRTRKAAGLDHIRLHDLRHHYASRLIAEGIDVVTVQHALGHSNPETTLRTYAHLWPQPGTDQLAAPRPTIPTEETDR